MRERIPWWVHGTTKMNYELYDTMHLYMLARRRGLVLLIPIHRRDIIVALRRSDARAVYLSEDECRLGHNGWFLVSIGTERMAIMRDHKVIGRRQQGESICIHQMSSDVRERIDRFSSPIRERVAELFVR